MKALVAVLVVGASAAAAPPINESPRSVAVELKLGPVTPMLDASPGLGTATPYASFFGGPLLLGELEIDYEIFQKVGTLSIGAGLGYGEKFGRAKLAGGADANDSVGLRILPLKAMLVYRFDYLALHHDIPLVPFIKAGGLTIPYWFLKSGKVETSDNLPGYGARYGVTAAAGLSLMLDFLDQRLARDFDTSAGVNHTYLFFEFTLDQIINVDPSLDFSSRHWMAGLTFEF